MKLTALLRNKLLSNRLKYLFYQLFTNKRILTGNTEKYNLKFMFFINDGLGKDIYYKHGVYAEDYITSYLLRTIDVQDDDFIIDIGANIGWYSLVLSHKHHPDVFSFEPDPSNFSLLKKNIELNNKTNIRLFSSAVSNNKGTSEFYIYKSFNLGRHSLIQQKNSIRSIEVQTIRLDDLLAEKNMSERSIKFIKIDIEGSEYNAMQGALKALQRCKYLLTEFTPGMMKRINQEPRDYINLLVNAGFILQVITPSGLQQVDFDQIIERNSQVNIFCHREKS